MIFTGNKHGKFYKAVLVLIILLILSGCSVLHIKKVDRSVQTTEIQDKKIARTIRKQEKSREKISSRLFRKQNRRHKKIQSPETRKRMKQNERKSRKLNKEKQRSFFDRLFNRRCN